MNDNDKFFLDQLQSLLDIDSTTGRYRKIQNYIEQQAAQFGYTFQETHKGGVIVDLGGYGDDLVLTAHLDTIGLMVRKINPDGTLNVCNVGGLYPLYCVGENVRIYTRDEKVFTGTVCRTPASVHVTENELKNELGDFRKNVCVVLDEDVKDNSDVSSLGIEVGDVISLDHRYNYSNGYIKSRFIDDKACAALLLYLMKYIKDNNITLNRKVLLYFACYEEIGHGTTYLPEGVRDIIALDIAPTGPDQCSDERKVSIFAKDSRFPYHYELANELRDSAIKENIDYCMDVFTPHYGSDGDGSVMAGYDIRHGAIGPGTANSHGYERTHISGLMNTFALIKSFLHI